jgi:hypothetical protein
MGTRYTYIDPSRGPKPSDPPPSLRPSRRHAGEFLKAHVGTVKDLVFLATGILAVISWIQNRASRDEVEAAKKQCIDTAASAIASAFAPVPPRLKVIEKRLSRNDQRWDRLDAWHVRAFAVPSRTPPPKFGPGAERRGEVRYEDEEEAE